MRGKPAEADWSTSGNHLVLVRDGTCIGNKCGRGDRELWRPTPLPWVRTLYSLSARGVVMTKYNTFGELSKRNLSSHTPEAVVWNENASMVRF